MAEAELKNVKQKKSQVNWPRLKKTALNIGIMAAGAFLTGAAMAAGQNVVNRFAPIGSAEDLSSKVVPLRPQKVG